MDRRTLGFLVGALVLVGLLGVGASVLGGRPASSGRPDGSTTVDGIVVGVDSTGLTSVTGFRLRTDDGLILQFGLASLRNRVEFPPGHLGEHAANSVRVRVSYREDGGRFEALWLEDAPTT